MTHILLQKTSQIKMVVNMKLYAIQERDDDSLTNLVSICVLDHKPWVNICCLQFYLSNILSP
jgi:hypothetical protein